MGELRPRVECEALDLPGFGESPPRSDGRYSISALADTVSALIERRGRGPVHLIGNSLGGAVALKVTARHPELVRSLTLISPALPDPRPRMDLVRFPLLGAPGLGNWLLEKFGTLPAERRVMNTFATCYCDPATIAAERFAVEVAELTRRDSLSYANAALIGCVRTLVAESMRGGPLSPWRDAARVTVPTLVIYGSRDRMVSARMAGRAARLFRDSRVVVLPRTGHLAMMEHPAAVAAEIEMLLDGGSAFRRHGQGRQEQREFPLMSTG